MRYPFIDYREPATGTEIQAWENNAAIQIPQQYRDFLLQSNGAGTYPGWGFTYSDPETGRLITDGIFSFLALGDINGIMTDLSNHKDKTGQSYHLDELIPIATNYCHSCTTMIGYKGDNYGKIILLDYVGFEDENGDLKKSIWLIPSMSSYRSFLRCLVMTIR